ncbi:MAG: ABC transporter ATP-binding protein, partial [Bacillota bacterium]|nr:ABC transporter ATP-binding protein [Bacillota bacterium]
YEVIRGFCILPHSRRLFDRENREAAEIKYKADKMLALNDGLSEILSNLIMVIVIFVGAYLLLRQSISAGTLVALVQLGGSFVAPVMLLLQMLPRIKGIAPVVERLLDFTAYEVKEFNGSLEPKFNREIAATGLTFGYTPEKSVLRDVDVVFKKGGKYAIVGKSGCGKSTLIKALTAYSAEYDGSVLIDGKELRTFSAEGINRLMAVIHQNVYMFDDTVRENISLGQDFSPKDWERALKLSGVDLFLFDLKQGLDTTIGEDGSELSGGQRQRLAVARALIRRTPIMILDEGTSSIDRQTAAEIEERLLSQKELTLITITHNLDPKLLMEYDEIIYIAEGRICDRGSLEQLNRKSGSFLDFQGILT